MIISPSSYWRMKVNKMPAMTKQVANRYEIDSLIGQGGMADVYLAQDTILNRTVAIKILRDKMSEDPMTLVRFQREASAASKLSHPNVVDIYDVGESEGMHYIVMEYIRGRSLKQLIQQRGALSVNEALHIMTQLTGAVKHAHLHNIIHRDIKPQNVLVKDDGTIKITDFGIAVANDSVQLTLNNAVMGSAHYLAPETAQGKDATVQVDIYSLGIVFYELLTGKVPYTGKTPTEIAIKHLRQPMPFVRDFNPDIPQSVENIILKATAKVSEERYENASLMLYDLEHCLDWQYKDMDRIEIKTPVISNVDVTDGHVKVEYSTPGEPEPAPVEKKRNFLSLPAKIGLVVVCVGIMALAAIGLGFIHIDGVMGYHSMPNVTKMTQQEAVSTLKKSDFDSISIEYAVSDKIEKDHVISTNYK
ncbi:MAG: Stk1 family PASTA domain-containing Ser/Thr kinase, partial [Erysipelotrichaceae bacterium]|nr:Stk1 family PASTA domain-containing Ser/Thr kinase [Erysipelotrichaceae bacterium]